MIDKNVQQETEKKPAARSRVSRGRTAGQSASAKRRREARKRALEQAQQGGNGGNEREGSDYRTVIGILNRYCGAKRLTYGDVNMFEFLAWLQNGERTQQGQTRAAGR